MLRFDWVLSKQKWGAVNLCEVVTLLYLSLCLGFRRGGRPSREVDTLCTCGTACQGSLARALSISGATWPVVKGQFPLHEFIFY